MPSDLSTKDILDRLDAIETRQSSERASARSENRWMNVLMLMIIAALAGIQITGFGISAKPKSDSSSEPSVVIDEPNTSPSTTPVVDNPSPNEVPVDPTLGD